MPNIPGSEHLAVIKVVGVGGGGTNAVNRIDVYKRQMETRRGMEERPRERSPGSRVVTES